MLIQVINLNIAKDRRKKYECDFAKKQLNFLRLEATNGLTDLKIIEIDDNNKEGASINIEELKNKKIELKEYKKYKIFDKNYPEFIVKYWLAKDKMIIKKRKRKRHLTVGEFGCMLSHFRAIYNVAKSKDKLGMIFEDDIILCDNFNEKMKSILEKAPKNFDILKFDNTNLKGKQHVLSFIISDIKYGFNKYFYNSKAEVFHGVSGAASYIITKKCAQKIIKLLEAELINGLEGAIDIFLYVILPKKYNFKNIWFIKKAILSQNVENSFIKKFGR